MRPQLQSKGAVIREVAQRRELGWHWHCWCALSHTCFVKAALGAISQCSVSGEPYLGWDESSVAYSGSYECSLVRGVACRTWSWFRGGRRDDRSSLRLLSAASFANAWAVHFTCQYLLISHSSLDSGVTDGGSNQEGILPNETGTEGRGEESGGFLS